MFKVPLYYSNDSPFNSLGFPFLFVSSGGPIMPDSITHAGRTYGIDIFQLFLGFSSGDFGGNPDSVCVGLISFYGEIPPGEGIIADFWFSGGQVGDLLSFVPIELYPPGCGIGPEGPSGPPVHVVTHVSIVARWHRDSLPEQCINPGYPSSLVYDRRAWHCLTVRSGDSLVRRAFA